MWKIYSHSVGDKAQPCTEALDPSEKMRLRTKVSNHCMALTGEMGATERPIQKQDGEADNDPDADAPPSSGTRTIIQQAMSGFVQKPGTFISHMTQ